MDVSKLQVVERVYKDSNDNDTIYTAIADAKIGTSIQFNYMDSDDFKLPIPDFTGFVTSLRQYLKNRRKEANKSFVIKGHRATGLITIEIQPYTEDTIADGSNNQDNV